MKKISIIACLAFFLMITYGSFYAEQPSAINKDGIVQKPVIQETFAIIKPDAVEAGYTPEILRLIELNDFEIVNMEKKTLTKHEAETFYGVHKQRPFFKALVEFMTSGPVVILKLKRDNAIKAWRDLMGTTNPAESPVGTLRAMFGTDKQRNATHGSDSAENAKIELDFFFPTSKTAKK